MRKIVFALALALPLCWSLAAFADDAPAEGKTEKVEKKGGKAKKGAKKTEKTEKTEKATETK